MKLREKCTAVKEAIQTYCQPIVDRLCASRWWIAARRCASGWRELARQPWPFWVGVSVLLLVVIGVVWAMTMGLPTVLPALIFFVALGLLVARVRYPLDASIGSPIFEVLCWLAASYIPGYIIFALVTDLPRNQDLNNIRPFLANQTAMIAGGGQGLLRELTKAAGYEAANPPTKEDFVEVCKRINPSDPAPMVRRIQPIEYVTWLEFLFEHRFRSARASEKLFRYMTFLNSEHIRLIIRIDESALFGELDSLRSIHLRGVPIRNTDLTWLADSLFRYYRLTRELQQYADRHLKGLAWSEPRD